MPITFNCPCGKVLRIADENAGKRIKCPACQAIGTAPAAAPVAPKFELVEDEPPAAKPKPAPAKPAPAKPVAKAVVEDDGFEVMDEDDKPKAKKKPTFAKGSRRGEDDEDEEEPKPKKKPRRDDDDDEPRPRRRKSGDPDAGQKLMYVIGGAVLVLVGIGVAVYWWNSGPHTGRRPYSGYIFGGCCVVVGIGTVVRGITGNFYDD